MKNVHISQVFDFWRNYQEIKLRFSSRQIMSFADCCPDCCIVTACNPRSVLTSESRNRLRMEKLQRYMDTKNLCYQKLICGSPDFSWQELSFAVFMPVDQGIKLARLYEQNAIYQVKGGEIWLVPVLIKGVETVRMGNIEDYLNT